MVHNAPLFERDAFKHEKNCLKQMKSTVSLNDYLDENVEMLFWITVTEYYRQAFRRAQMRKQRVTYMEDFVISPCFVRELLYFKD
jgi:hypothetical protein